VPVLETPQGGIWESNAIARYVARLSDKGLFGSTLFEAVGASIAGSAVHAWHAWLLSNAGLHAHA
jgi:glutathione S-transferase